MYKKRISKNLFYMKKLNFNKLRRTKKVFRYFFYIVQGMRCCIEQKFVANRSILKLSRNWQSWMSVHYRVSLKGSSAKRNGNEVSSYTQRLKKITSGL
jgi:hypothetical protein